MDACVFLLPPSNHPVVSTPTLASLQTDPAGHNDDKSAQIFMSIEFHFGSAHGSFSAFFYGSLCGGHSTCSQTIIITLHKHTLAPVMSPKHQLTVNVHRGPSLWLPEEWYKHRSLSCPCVDFCVGFVTNLFSESDVHCIFYVEKRVCLRSPKTKQQSKVMEGPHWDGWKPCVTRRKQICK